MTLPLLILLSQKVAEFSCEGRCILRGFVFSMQGMRGIFAGQSGEELRDKRLKC